MVPLCGRRLGLGLLVLAAIFLSAPVSAVAAPGPAPLLMDGKTSLYQRVLTRPGAILVAQPPSTSGRPVPALSQFYVYDRQSIGGREWLAVGAGSRGRVDGWIGAETTLPWKSQMTLAFTNPAGRDRTLLFDSRSTVLDLVKAPDPARKVAPIRAAVEAGTGDPRVLSIEPETHIDIAKQFYLLPILEAEEVDTAAGFRVRVLEVASVTKQEDGPSPLAAEQAVPPRTDALRTFSAAVVFVIDSTISMGPYIDRTREAVASIFRAVEKAGLGQQVKFGLVAYRSNIDVAPGLEYVTRVYADPNAVTGSDDFLNHVADLRPARVSSAKFDEDAYAGVMTAVEDINWDRFGGRYVVLISDAGALAGSDALSATGLDAEQVRLELERKGIALYAFHLKTAEGRRNHRSAERQYRELAFNAVVTKPLYYEVEAGSVERFGEMVDRLAQEIVAQVQGAARGEMVPGSAQAARRQAAAPGAQSGSPDLAEDTRLLGLAMQLAYLGRVESTAAPPLFRAWLADRDLATLDRPTTEVRVLLTKNQLSDLAQVVEAILRSGDQSQLTGTADFFDLIRSAAAHLARDPAALNDPKATRLGELGLLGEYLDDLPYRSAVMSLSRDVWASWSITEQEELLDKLRRKLRLYQLFNDDVDRWVTLAPGADPGDAVYPVPLTALP